MNEIERNVFREANRVAGQIRQGIHNYLGTLALIGRAWDEEHWRALGYDSWQEYLDGEFGAERLRLPAEHRQKAVAELRMLGMSQRQIGQTLSVGQSTVRDDLAQLSGSTQLPDQIRGEDGRTRSATKPPAGRDSNPESGGLAVATPDQPDQDHPSSLGVRSTERGPAGEADAQLDATGASGTTGEREAPTVGAVGAGETAADAGPQSADGRGEGVSPITPARAAPAGAPTDFGAAGAPVNPLDDPEQVEADHRRRSSAAVAEALAVLLLRLDPDPIRWLENTWMPDAYPQRDLPRVRDAFTVDGLHRIAKHIDTIADHIDRDGEGEL